MRPLNNISSRLCIWEGFLNFAKLYTVLQNQWPQFVQFAEIGWLLFTCRIFRIWKYLSCALPLLLLTHLNLDQMTSNAWFLKDNGNQTKAVNQEIHNKKLLILMAGIWLYCVEHISCFEILFCTFSLSNIILKNLAWVL